MKGRNKKFIKKLLAMIICCLMIDGLFPIHVMAEEIGTLTTVAGSGGAGYSGDEDIATAALLNEPISMVFDNLGNMYIADCMNHRIRKMDTSGIITTVAGNGELGFSGDRAPATSARLNAPSDVALDSAGNLYIADTGNDRIRKVSTSGNITTIIGRAGASGIGDGGPAASAKVASPRDIAFDSIGNLYIADTMHHRIRKVDASGTITTVAGLNRGYSGDGGRATEACLDQPRGLAFDASGNMYIADYGNNRIRKVDTSGIMTTVVGSGTRGYSGDGGPAVTAQLNRPWGLEFDNEGNMYIADCDNQRIRKVDTNGIISTVAGISARGFFGDGRLATSSTLNCPTDIKFDRAGNLYIADAGNSRIRKIQLVQPNTSLEAPAVIPESNIGVEAGTATVTNRFMLEVGTGPDYYYKGYFSKLKNLGSSTEKLLDTGASNEHKGIFVWGKTVFTNFQLKREFANGSKLHEWSQRIEAGQRNKKNGVLTLLDKDGKTIAKWKLEGIWPSGLTYGTDEYDDDKCSETLELTVDKISMLEIGTRPIREMGTWLLQEHQK